MYRPWWEQVCWWEAVVLLQTVTLVMVTTFGFALGPYHQFLVAAAALALALVLLAVVRPFERPAANSSAMLSVSVLCVTAYSALAFLPYGNTSPGHVFGNILGAAILAANVAFLAFAVWRLLKGEGYN